MSQTPKHAHRVGRRDSAIEERAGGADELGVILEDAAMAGILVDVQFRTRNAPRQIDAVLRRHHDVVIAVSDEHRLVNMAEVLRRLKSPGLDRLQLAQKRLRRDRLVPIPGPFLQSRQKGFGSLSAVGG